MQFIKKTLKNKISSKKKVKKTLSKVRKIKVKKIKKQTKKITKPVKTIKEKTKFFNLGKENKWENILDKKIKEEIEIKFYKEMKELKYI